MRIWIQLITLKHIRIRIQLITWIRIRILPFNLMRINVDPARIHNTAEECAHLIKMTMNVLYVHYCFARGSSVVNPQQQVATICLLPLLDGNWQTQGTLQQ